MMVFIYLFSWYYFDFIQLTVVNWWWKLCFCWIFFQNSCMYLEFFQDSCMYPCIKHPWVCISKLINVSIWNGTRHMGAHGEVDFKHRVKINRNQIVFIIHRLIWNTFQNIAHLLGCCRRKRRGLRRIIVLWWSRVSGGVNW